MPLKDSSGPAQHGQKLSGAELEEFAERFVDKILDPSTPSLRTTILAGLEYPELSKEIARSMGFPADVHSSAWAHDMTDAVKRMDRKKLVALAKTALAKDPPTEEQAQQFLAIDLGRLMRMALQDASRQFTAKRGRKPKAERRDYPKIAAWGDKLYPVCLRLMTELQSSPHKPVRNLLESCKQDYPEACMFLLHHLAQFELATKDKGLRKRAAGIEARARLLSDAIAGADYNLKFRTSIERAREGRRSRARTRS